VEALPEVGIGYAIMNRVKRSAEHIPSWMSAA
jgi:hypothetical protein